MARATLASLVLLCVPRAAAARDVEYRAPAECPAADLVRGRLETASPRGRPTRLAIEKSKDGFHGEAVIGEGEGRVVRTIDARSCAAVVEALELAVALRSDGDEPARAAPTANEPPSRPGAPSTDGTPARDLAPAAADVPVSSAPSSPPRLWTVGAAFSYTSFSEARGALAGGALFADLALPTRLGDVSVLQPSVRASLGVTFPNTKTGDRTSVATAGSSVCADCGPRITIVKSALDFCPIGMDLEGTVSLAACGRGELGVLFADVSGTSASAGGQLWVAAGPVVRARVMWGSGPIRPAFEVTAGLLAPLRRDHFHFDDYPTETAAPWLWTLGFGGALVFQ